MIDQVASSDIARREVDATSPPPQPKDIAIWRRWVLRVFDAVLVLAVVTIGLVAYGLIDNRWYHIVVVKTGSMSPAIEPGDAIVITPPPDDLEPGMIATMEIDAAVVTHRIIEVDDQGNIRTQGDANPTADDWGDNEIRIAGVERLTLPWLGRFLQAVGAVDTTDAFFARSVVVAGEATPGEPVVESAPQAATATASQQPADPQTAERSEEDSGTTAGQESAETQAAEEPEEASGAATSRNEQDEPVGELGEADEANSISSDDTQEPQQEDVNATGLADSSDGIVSVSAESTDGQTWLTLVMESGEVLEGAATELTDVCPSWEPLLDDDGVPVGDPNGDDNLGPGELWSVHCRG